MRALRSVLVVCLSVALGGCFVVSREHLDNLESGDSGMDTSNPGDTSMEDTGEVFALNDRCGQPTPLLRVSTEGQIKVDTRMLANRISDCNGRPAPGNDGFVAIDVTAGERWHFHVVPDPTVSGQDRDPFLYLLPQSCFAAACVNFSNTCTGAGDEHFAFEALNTETVYLGIDDVNPGGGQYEINAIRLDCGDGVSAHGESCDGDANCMNCRKVLSGATPNEAPPNDNTIEANMITFPASNMLTLTGSIGDDGSCTYPDVFQFTVVNAGSDLNVDFLKSDGFACDSGTLTPFRLVLRQLDGTIVAMGMDSAAGCEQLIVPDLPAATYFLSIELPTAITSTSYRMRMQLTL